MKKTRELKVDKNFRLRLDPEVLKWILSSVGKTKYGDGNIPSRATELFHCYKVYRKGFLISLIENHYEEIRYLLRKIGRVKKKYG